MKRFIVLSFILLLIGGTVGFAQEAKMFTGDRTRLHDDIPDFVGYVPNAIVVKFDPSVVRGFNKSLFAVGKTGNRVIDVMNQRFDAKVVQEMFPKASAKLYKGKQIDLSGYIRIRFNIEHNDIEKVVAEYSRLSGVLKAEPIAIHTVHAIPNDTRFPDQWHLNQANDHDIDAPEAWDIETGNEAIIVGILDTGVRYFHKDLGGSNASYANPTNAVGNMWINWAEKNGTPGVDDDGNGFIDDWIGWDFVDGAGTTNQPVWPGEDGDEQDNDPRDFNGHGTHCAGNVGAINNNGYATASASGGWGGNGNGVKVMALRIGWSAKYWRNLNIEVGFVRMDFAAQALYYAADNGANIVSCSWGSSNSSGMDEAIDYFLAAGGLIFKSAGNSDNESADYMCGRSDVISVAATDQNDCKSDFSSYGTWVDISSPGTAIMSLYHNHEDPENDYVATMDGTSMASPIAASVAALIWSQNPGWSASQVKQKLFDSADNIYNLSCNSSYNGKLGAGRVNAYNAVAGGTPAPPVANFVGSPTSGNAPLTVNFTDQSTGSIDSWSWDFGDGGTSTAQNPSHTYNSEGTYTVSLTVTGPGGSDTETKVDYITATSTPPAPVADFVGSPTSGTAPLTVNFTDQSTGTIDSWSWDFGDGGTSTAQNPSHTYNSAGTFTVSLTVTGPGGSDNETKVDYITATSEPIPPVAEFVGSPTSGTAPLNVTFTDQSTGTIESWAWDFGDGGTSTEQNPSHTYNSEGTYTVSLTVTGPDGSDTETKVDYITVTSTPPAPVADFVGSPTSGTAPLTVNFTDQSTGTIDSWSWDFGDGGTSTAQNPSHTYNSAGTFTVSLTVTGPGGSDTEEKTDYITVEPGGGNLMHVNDVKVTKVSLTTRLSYGRAEVQIVDQNGSPVEGATVSGEWTQGASGTITFTTDSNGWGTGNCGYGWNVSKYCFRVDDVTKTDWTYDSGANVKTWACSDGSAGLNSLPLINPGTSETITTIEQEMGEDVVFAYPNPFNSTTMINFYIPETGNVTIDIFNILGEKIATILDSQVSAGLNSVLWNGTDSNGALVGAGNYFFKVRLPNGEAITKRMLLLK